MGMATVREGESPSSAAATQMLGRRGSMAQHGRAPTRNAVEERSRRPANGVPRSLRTPRLSAPVSGTTLSEPQTLGQVNKRGRGRLDCDG